ncbi:MAG: PepSY domain-containing protein [Planctomycetes bacterium]|nr:PepSY domain-containing protein [Planctomycetota bacterium]
MKFSKLNRLIHRWGSIVTLVPVGVMVVTGVVLQLKKDVAWIQPPTRRGVSDELTIGFDHVLEVTRRVPESQVDTWDDIDRLDVRPDRGMLKVQCQNGWEVQIDGKTGDVLQVAYRRSDILEGMHDGSFFHESLRLWLFLPCGVALVLIWLTGAYLFFWPYFSKVRRQTKSH